MTRRQHLEQAIRTAVEQLTEVELAETDLGTSLVELGFDSLLVMQIARKVSQRFGVPLKLSRLLDDLSSVHALAAHLDALLPNSHSLTTQRSIEKTTGSLPSGITKRVEPDLPYADTLKAVPPRPPLGDILARQVSIMQRQLALLSLDAHAAVPPRAPLSESVAATEAQAEIWSAIALGGEAVNLAYNESISLVLRGALDEAALSNSLAALVVRHEALRSTFSSSGGLVHFTAPEETVPYLVREDLRVGGPALDLESRRARIAAARRREVTTPFDLRNGPLVRFQLLKLGDDESELLVTVHRLACDGSSLDVLVSELGRLYTSEVTGVPDGLGKSGRFSDYARQDVAAARTQEGAIDAAFWLEQHRDTSRVLDLPTDRPRPARRTLDAARECRTLSSTLVRRLGELGKSAAGASLAATLLAGVEVLLFRISGERHFAVAMPFADRTAVGGAGLVGHCVRTLPLRANVDPETPFVEHLRTVRAHLYDARDHRQFTFGALLKELSVPRDASRSPLSPVLFDFERSSGIFDFAGLHVTRVTNPRAFEHFELSLSASEQGDEVVLALTYDTQLFDRGTAHRRLAELEVLLEAAASNPDTKIGDLPILAADEARAILALARPSGSAPTPRDVATLVEEQVRRSPDAIAVLSTSAGLTYRELDDRANQLARHLVALGVREGDRVGIAVDRSVELFVSLLGVLKATATYVPLDPDYPPARLDFIARDARLSVIVTEQRFENLLPSFDARRVYVDTDAARVAAESKEPLPRSDDPDRIAYVLHTSGSTGKPKGVLVPHGAVVNFLLSMATEPGLLETDVVAAVTTLSFDIAVLELFLPLTVGAKVAILSRDVAADGRRLAEALDRFDVTVMQATPSSFRLLLDAGFLPASRSSGRAGTATNRPPFKALVGGEALPRDLARALLESGATVWNMYGPTETTVWSLCHRVENVEGPVPIGRPIARTDVHVLDPRGRRVPIGIPGELYIGGAGVARGYLDRPELTLERFVESPFEPGATLYRTGDLVRFTAEGLLVFERRLDRQVKVRGHRIELEEIEAVISAHPGVRECAALLREDTPTDVRIVLYVAGDAASVSTRELRRRIEDALPVYMIPQHFVVLEALPRTPNGKVDVRALPDPRAAGADPEGDFVAARSDTERALVSIWSELLSAARVGVEDDFFALGGHSILATRMLSRVSEQLGVDIGLRQLLKAKTIAALAAHIDGVRARPAEVLGPVSSSSFEEVLL